jgi:hypothetical protein
MGEDWEEKKMQWQNIKDSVHRLGDMMMGMNTAETENIKSELEKPSEAVSRMDEMMMEKHEEKEDED